MTTNPISAIIDEASKHMECPKCKAVAHLNSPLTKTDKRMAVYGCTACGFAFKADGGAYLADATELKDFFRAASLGNQTLMHALAGEKLNPATRALLTALMLEYGSQMWFDGLKQGLLLGAIQAEKGKA